MKDGGSSYHGQHLKYSIAYITKPEKTQDGRLIRSMNCTIDGAYEEMKATKKRYHKIDKRQGYHLVLSFQEGEATPDVAMEITEKFVQAYLGKEYESVYAVHDNTDHIHSHIVFNSVSCLHGGKYHYAKGDWKKSILPIVNELCESYGLSVLQIDDEKVRTRQTDEKWSNGKNDINWSPMIRRDIDACILQAATYESFLSLLKEKGYELKNSEEQETGKYLSVKPMGMNRYRRCKTLGDSYTEEQIRRRIMVENLSTYRKEVQRVEPRIVYAVRVPRYRRTKMTGIQKLYFAKLYRTGKLKKRPYSQAWKYRKDIQKMQQLQKQYNFLRSREITSVVELWNTTELLAHKKAEITKEKRTVFKERSTFKSLFQMYDQMKELHEAELSYKSGDSFFQDEHETYQKLKEELEEQGYTYQEVGELKEYYKGRIGEMNQKERAIKQEIKVAESLVRELEVADAEVKLEEVREQKEREQERQPPRR